MFEHKKQRFVITEQIINDENNAFVYTDALVDAKCFCRNNQCFKHN